MENTIWAAILGFTVGHSMPKAKIQVLKGNLSKVAKMCISCQLCLCEGSHENFCCPTKQLIKCFRDNHRSSQIDVQVDSI